MRDSTLSSGLPSGLPRPTPRILNTDESVPLVHLALVDQALAQIAAALRDVRDVAATYAASDPRARELRNLSARGDMVLFEGRSWLAWHPAHPAAAARYGGDE